MSAIERIVFAGGGTGGHLFPAIAVAEVLRQRSSACEILFVGSERPIERKILREAGYAHRPLSIESTATLRRHPIRFLKNYWKANSEAKRIVAEFQPQIVVGSGGFASLPMVRTAQKRSVPTLLLEQNLTAGRATRWLQSRAQRICHAYAPSTFEFHDEQRHIVTGNPVRREIAQLAQQTAPLTGRPVRTILVLGGSQGSLSVNRIWMSVVEQMSAELASIRILHQTGDNDVDGIREAYARRGLSAISEPFFEVLPTLYRQSDLVISRAGATTLAELACAGLPAVLIPIPDSYGDHQRLNARHFVNAGAARMVEQQPELPSSANALRAELNHLLANDLMPFRAAMWKLARPDAATSVADVLEQLVSDSV